MNPKVGKEFAEVLLGVLGGRLLLNCDNEKFSGSSAHSVNVVDLQSLMIGVCLVSFLSGYSVFAWFSC